MTNPESSRPSLDGVKSSGLELTPDHMDAARQDPGIVELLQDADEEERRMSEHDSNREQSL